MKIMNKERNAEIIVSDEKYRIQNIIQRSPNRIMNSYHQENRGKRWSSEEDRYLLQQIEYMEPSEIGKHLKRSENGVISRLKKLAFHMIQGGEDPSVVQANLKLSDEDMEHINNEFFIYPKKNTSKFITNVKSPQPKKGYFQNIPNPPKQEVQLLLEIRSMLKKLLSQQNQVYTPLSCRSPAKETKLNGGVPLHGQGTIRVFDINVEELEKRSEEFAKMN